MFTRITTALARLRTAWGAIDRDDDADRGDVPGWVLVTFMTSA